MYDVVDDIDEELLSSIDPFRLSTFLAICFLTTGCICRSSGLTFPSRYDIGFIIRNAKALLHGG